MGLPVIPVEYMATLGSLGDIVLIDPGRYVLTEAESAINGVLSLHVRFLNDEGIYRWTWRIDGQPYDVAPITPANSGATLSSFVALAARP